MAITTGIQWCDSTGNIQMGCEGCELVKKQHKTRCYAHQLTNHYGGRPGWPETFLKPKIFMERLPKICGWSNLTNTKRPDKPWLDGLPRVIFLNDMGDTFTNGLPKDWFAEALPQIAASPHIFMLLTKWPHRMAKFAERHRLPKNLWPGTSVTSHKTAFRAEMLNNVKGGGVKWLSVEPMWSQIFWDAEKMRNIGLMIYGGESGSNATPFDIEWLKFQLAWCADHYKASFVKQLGSNTYAYGQKINFKDSHAGDWNEWPLQLQIRQFPNTFLSNN